MVSVYWVTECVCLSTQMLSAKLVRPEPSSDTNWPTQMIRNVLKPVLCGVSDMCFPCSGAALAVS